MRKTALERFRAKVNSSAGADACWPWVGAISGVGYGVFWDGAKLIGAHRYAYLIAHSSIPIGCEVCHHCDNRSCCNPAHLFTGTRKDNMVDCSHKGRVMALARPERLARGAANGSYTKPHKRPRGERHGNAILTEESVRFILANKGAIGQRRLAKMFNTTQATVSRIHRRLSWAHVSP